VTKAVTNFKITNTHRKVEFNSDSDIWNGSAPFINVVK